VWISSNSILYNVYVSIVYKNTRDSEVIHQRNSEWIFFRSDFTAILKKWSCYKRNIDIIVSLKNKLDQMGIKMVFVPVPDKSAIIQTYSPFNVKYASNQRKRFIKDLEKKGLKVIDLTSNFIESDSACKLYRKNDTHWGQSGICLAAEVISSQMSNKMQEKTNYLFKDTTVLLQGDLSKFVQDSTFYSVECRKVLLSDSTDFKEVPSSEIVIFGDSFTRKNREFNAGIGAWIAYFQKQPTKTYSNLNANIEGPRLLLNYLEKSKSLPAVVVWIISSRFLMYPIENFQ
jgi:hypothetical protein